MSILSNILDLGQPASAQRGSGIINGMRDLSQHPTFQAMRQRQQSAEMRKQMPERPDLMRALASMPPALGEKVVAQLMAGGGMNALRGGSGDDQMGQQAPLPPQQGYGRSPAQTTPMPMPQEAPPDGGADFYVGAGMDALMGQQGGDTLAPQRQDDGVQTRRLEDMEFNARNAMARIQEINNLISQNPDAFDDMTFGGMLRRKGLEWKDWLGGELDAEETEYLTGVTRQRAAILENINYTIKEITGAQMSNGEAERIRATLPDIHDSPTQFKAKLARAQESSMMAIARYNYWKQQGQEGAPEDVSSLDNMQNILRQRGADLYREFTAQGMPAADARMAAAQALSAEFGI